MRNAERIDWLRRLPRLVGELAVKWKLRVAEPFDSRAGGGAWVAPAVRANGEGVILKIPFPHMECEQEVAGLRYWAGDPVVRVFESDDTSGAMVLERCLPGTSLREWPGEEQDLVVATMLRRLWRPRGSVDAFRPLSYMVDAWATESASQSDRWPDRGLVEYGLQIMHELSRPRPSDVLLGTDIHAGNVLRAQREPWLVIDPKPFVGDLTYDATQHLMNCGERLAAEPARTIDAFAARLEIDSRRLKAWLFARFAAEPREVWSESSLQLARALRP